MPTIEVLYFSLSRYIPIMETVSCNSTLLAPTPFLQYIPKMGHQSPCSMWRSALPWLSVLCPELEAEILAPSKFLIQMLLGISTAQHNRLERQKQ